LKSAALLSNAALAYWRRRKEGMQGWSRNTGNGGHDRLAYFSLR
jgi:hypothetical protein